MQNVSVLNMADAAELSSDEVAQLTKSIEGNEQAPSSRAQTWSYQFFLQNLQQLGSPYDVTHIPISVLEQMQRDPMIAFGLYFLHVPIMRAKWHIECERADIAEFIDRNLRRILGRYITQRKQAMYFGFAPIIKRFQKEIPNWTFVDPSKSDKPRKVWNNGPVEAITWKPFQVLPSDPTVVEPRFDGSGAFNGMKWQGGANMWFPNVEEKDKGPKTIDIYHSLWITNEKDSSQGSLWGYPHIGYAYRAWWSYWHRWAYYDRFFERKADPPYVVYYPPAGTGSDDEDTENESMKQHAIRIADNAKSGGSIALPGQTVASFDERPSTVREWEIFELEIKGNLDDFLEQFNYLDVMKLRGLWIPEQALMEGRGGTSSRNVAEAEIGLHKEGSAALSDEIDEELNRWVIPDLVAANFPNYRGECRKVTTGFTEADQQIQMQVVQAFAQNDPSALKDIDLRGTLDNLGISLVSHKEIERREKEIEKEIEDSNPPLVNPDANGNAGVVATPPTAETNGQPQFSYIQSREILKFAEATKFPQSKHFKDKAVLSQAQALNKRWEREYKAVYEDFAKFIKSADFPFLEFTDNDFIEYLNLDAKLVPNNPATTNWVERKGGLPKFIADIAGDLISEKGFSVSRAIATAVNRCKVWCRGGGNVTAATKAKACAAIAQWEKMKLSEDIHLDDADDRAARIMKNWLYPEDKIEDVIEDSKAIIKKAIDRAGKVELDRIGQGEVWNPDTEVVADFLEERSLGFVKAIDDTTREEIQILLADLLREGLDQEDIATVVRAHFSDFPEWKAARMVRSEIRDSYNFATLIGGEQAGVKIVQAKDAQLGDTDETCMERDGKFFPVGDALVESLTEHPNGTLEWILIPNRDNLSLQHVKKMPDDSDAMAYFDDTNNQIYILETVSKEAERTYLRQLGETLSR